MKRKIKCTFFVVKAFLLVGAILSTQILFQRELQMNEKILWSGQPKQGFFLTGRELLAVLVGLFFMIIGSFFEYLAIESFNLFLIIFMLPFVLVGLYVVFWSTIYKNYLKKRTYYAVTNQRVLILINSFNKKVESKLISQIPVLKKNVKKDGSGTIQFDNNRYIDAGGDSYRVEALSFDNIKDVDTVYKMISDLRSPHEVSHSIQNKFLI